ncbi:uncharacterized protein LOC132204968 [Neocloeon triangulifer]|uniref:uncharacterized protein LOC132204968 n=1 Tax=Neocloeon triangulifer TaxID=2078957 RepID=UPI00286EF10B|nr:uncharacterized protein LOC132204968 [Neocloeon triangulifer]
MALPLSTMNGTLKFSFVTQRIRPGRGWTAWTLRKSLRAASAPLSTGRFLAGFGHLWRPLCSPWTRAPLRRIFGRQSEDSERWSVRTARRKCIVSLGFHFEIGSVVVAAAGSHLCSADLQSGRRVVHPAGNEALVGSKEAVERLLRSANLTAAVEETGSTAAVAEAPGGAPEPPAAAKLVAVATAEEWGRAVVVLEELFERE